MKKLIFTLALQACVISVMLGQISGTKTLPEGTVTKITTATASIAGNWSGTQTNDYGQNPQAISFQLTTSGEFIIANPNGSVAAKGSYTFSNNTINGTYKLTSSGETISFTGTYDPSTQKLNCTLGSGTKTTGQGKWLAVKNAAVQIQTVKKPIVNNTTVSTQPAPAPAPAPVTSTNTTIAYYYLTNVTVKIYTGNDNKESPSLISVNLFLPPGSSNYQTSGNQPGPSLIFTTDSEQTKYKAELKSNSVSNIIPVAVCFPRINGRPDYRSDEVSLSTINRGGLLLDIYYMPNFFTDAWKIEKVELILEFKEENGKPHPMLGNKTITFTKSNVLLTQANNKLSLATDKFLLPIN